MASADLNLTQHILVADLTIQYDIKSEEQKRFG